MTGPVSYWTVPDIGASIKELTQVGASSRGLPRTAANIAVCKQLAQNLAGRASIQQLAGMVLESNAPVSPQLRKDVASYAVFAVTQGTSAPTQAQAQAQSDCAKIGY